MSDIRIIHFRCREGAKVLTTGGVTVAVRMTDTGREAAYAICSAADGFNPTEGRKRALARLNSKPKRGRKNTRVRHQDIRSTERALPIPEELPGQLCEGFDFMEELELSSKRDMVISFAWDVAVHAVMTMCGGTLEHIERLRTTLKAFPREKKSA